MFNPWDPFNPNQFSTNWGQQHSNPPIPPVFAQLFDLSKFISSMANPTNNPLLNQFNTKFLEDLIQNFSLQPFLSNFPQTSAFLQNYQPLNTSNLQNPAIAWLSNLPQAPALGITREFQEDWTELSRLMHRYEISQREFIKLLQSFVQSATESYTSILTNATELQDFDALCRKWIDCCEVEFQKISSTEDYSVKFGQMINDQLRLMRHYANIQENQAKLNRQPTRTELDELHRKNAEAIARIAQLEKTVEKLSDKTNRNPKSPIRKSAKKG